MVALLIARSPSIDALEQVLRTVPVDKQVAENRLPT